MGASVQKQLCTPDILSRMFMPKMGAMERPDGEDTEEARFAEELERDLKTDPYLKVHQSDIKAFRAFRREFKLNRFEPEELNIYVIHPDRNVAISRAFRKGDSIPHFTFLEDSGSEARMLEKKSGLTVVKGKAERHENPEKSDIVVLLDENVRPTRHLLGNVEAGGWLLCRMKNANAVRSTGKYELMGVIEKEGGAPRIERRAHDLWKKAEITSDEELQSASAESGEVSYAEAREAVEKAGLSTKNVLESYKKLIQMAEEQNASRVAMGETQLPCTVEGKNGESIEMVVNTVIPLKEAEQNGENIVVFKKHETV